MREIALKVAEILRVPTLGYSAAVTQHIGENLSASLIYGSIGALSVEAREIITGDPDELRAMIRAGTGGRLEFDEVLVRGAQDAQFVLSEQLRHSILQIMHS